MNQIIIARYQNNISINEFEFVMNNEDQTLCFDNKEIACGWLNKNCCTNLTIEEWENNEGIYFFERNLDEDLDCVNPIN